MKAIRIGDVPLEWFTGAGELRSHDKACNNMTREELLTCQPTIKVDIQIAIKQALRKERKEKKYLKKHGIDRSIKIMGCGVSTRDLFKQ